MRSPFRSSSALCLAVFSLSFAAAGCGRRSATDKAPQTRALVGAAGDATVAGTQTVNAYAAVTAIPNTTTIEVTSAAGFAAGDLALVIQMQGASIDTSDTAGYGDVTALNGAGNFELVQIDGIAGNTLSLAAPGLKRAYTAAGRVQVVRVPQYLNLTIAGGGRVTAPAWNGTTGGVVALHVNGALTLDGDVDASGLGFRGGALDNSSRASGTAVTLYRSTAEADGGEKGESIAGAAADYDSLGGRYGRGAPANAGGGGNSHNAGGGGGANAGNGNVWTGQGVMSGAVLGAMAWTLDPGYIANGNALTTSSGGGRGGYTYNAANHDALTVPPGDASWGGNNRRPVGGLGGRPLSPDPLQRLYFGGGGGAGDANNNHGGRGGNGGGIVVVIANTINGAGRLLANGEDGQTARLFNGDAPGGGGGGGTVLVIARSALAGVSLQARGGKGGDQDKPGENEGEGPGGGGGGGFVAVRGGAVSVDVAGGASGTTNSPSLTEFPVNGATNGAPGQQVTVPDGWPQVINIPADVRVAVSNGATVVGPGTTVNYTVTVTNAGQNLATGVTVSDSTGGLQGVTWTCTATAGSACPAASGNGEFSGQLVDVAAGGVVTIVVTGTVPAGAMGTITNTATIIVPAGLVDDAGNNTATDTDAVMANSTPAATNDVLSVQEDTPAVANVLANDTGLDDGPLSVVIGAPPLHGRAVVNPDNTITYTPDADYHGPDAFTYVVVDAQGERTVGAVQVTVAPVDDTPAAVADNVTVAADQGARLRVLANDTGLGDGPLVVTVTQPSAGTVVVNPDGTVSYTPDPGHTGADLFSYTVRDADGQTSTAVVSVTVAAGPPTPMAVDDAAVVVEDQPATLTPLANDTGLDNGPIVVTITTAPARGTAVVNPDGSLRYTPAPDYNGADTIGYRITDSKGATATASIAITVTAANDTPATVPDRAQIGVGQTAVVAVLANDRGVGDGPLLVTAGPASSGTASVDGAGRVVFTPAPGFMGTVSVPYTVRDADGEMAMGTLEVTVGTAATPMASDDAVTTAEDAPIHIDVLANDTGLGSTPVSVRVSSSPARGDVRVNADGSITYLPARDFYGVEELTYELTDAAGTKASARVVVTVTPVNDDPEAFPDVAMAAADGAALTINVLANDRDVDGDMLSVTAVGTPARGTAVVQGMSVVYTPMPGMGGWDVFTYTVSDGRGGTVTGWVVVRVPAFTADAGMPDAGELDAGVPDAGAPEDAAPVGMDMALPVDAAVPDAAPAIDAFVPPPIDMAPPMMVDAGDAGTIGDGGADATDGSPDLGAPTDAPDAGADTSALDGGSSDARQAATLDAGAEGGGSIDGDFWDGRSLRGGGCSVGGDRASSPWSLALLALPLLLRRRRRGGAGAQRAAGFLVALIITVAAVTAVAQPESLQSYPIERFRLATGRSGLLGAEWGQTPAKGTWNFGLWLGYADDPMVVYDAMTGARVLPLVDHRVGGSLVGSYALHDRFLVGVDVPLVYHQGRDEAPLRGAAGDLQSFGFGDIRVVPKLGLVRDADDGFSLALIPAFTVPISGGKSFLGDDGFTFAPELAASFMTDGGLRFAANVGTRLRRSLTVVDLEVGSEVFGTVGLGLRFGGERRAWEIDATVAGATGLDEPFSVRNRNALEATLGLVHDFDGPVSVFVAGGPGLRQGFGTPDFRVLGGLWLRSTADDDPDRDGIRGKADRCPTDPEDKDGWQDQDGCPDPDNDKDGIPDRSDSCPNEPEIVNGYQDKDGCADQPPDTDADGLRDPEDRCPTDPEDRDEFEDEDGCPDPDNDKDGTLDRDDRCPMEPGPVGNQGCPDPDRDGDTVPDRLDNCPDEPGPPENQGCKLKQKAVLREDRIEILEAVYFQTNKDVIQRKSFDLLDNVATILNAHPEITRVRVEGHTDSVGSDRRNQDLSERRARSVVKYLVRKGVAADRLAPQGFGESQPIADNATAEGRAQNRRVVFNIERGN